MSLICRIIDISTKRMKWYAPFFIQIASGDLSDSHSTGRDIHNKYSNSFLFIKVHTQQPYAPFNFKLFSQSFCNI